MARSKQKQNASGVWILAAVALVAAVGLWMMQEPTQTQMVAPPAPEPEMAAPAPVQQLDAATLAAAKLCQQDYDYRFELCNRRTHQESVDNCLMNAEEILAACLANI